MPGYFYKNPPKTPGNHSRVCLAVTHGRMKINSIDILLAYSMGAEMEGVRHTVKQDKYLRGGTLNSNEVAATSSRWEM